MSKKLKPSATDTTDTTDAYKSGPNTLEQLLASLGELVIEGQTGNQLEDMAKVLIAAAKVEPVFLGYKPEGAKEAYPNILCVSINNEVIHGLPDDRKFEVGDVVSIDLGIKENGLIYDGAVTVLCGPKDAEGRIRGCSAAARKLVTATREALEAGVAAAKDGNTNFSITEAIEMVIKKYDLTVVNGYGGHGVSDVLHAPPFIANRAADVKGEPFKLTAGMRIAIEPMVTTCSSGETYVDKNGWTVKVRSGLAAHFEKTVIVS